MSFFPIDYEKLASQSKKKSQPKLTKENIKHKRERNKTRTHSIKDIRKNQKILDQQARIKITDIQNVMKKHAIWSSDEIRLISAYCVQEKLFDNAFTARMFITCFKNEIFSTDGCDTRFAW